MYTEAQIVNLALGKIGETSYIDNLNSPHPAAQAANAVWAHCRDEILSAWRWPFATRRHTPAKLDTEHPVYDHVYALPSDVLRMCEVNRIGQPNPREDQKVEWHLEYLDGQRVMVAHEDELTCVYTARVDEPHLYPPGFVEAFSWRLASELAMSIARSPDMAHRCRQMYHLELMRAQGSEASQEQAAQTPDPDWIANR
jgi:hypothetical protein